MLVDICGSLWLLPSGYCPSTQAWSYKGSSHVAGTCVPLWSGWTLLRILTFPRSFGTWPRMFSLRLAACLNRGNLKSQDVGTCHFLQQDEEIEWRMEGTDFSNSLPCFSLCLRPGCLPSCQFRETSYYAYCKSPCPFTLIPSIGFPLPTSNKYIIYMLIHRERWKSGTSTLKY